MPNKEFARLSDTNPRDAWRDEARDFTPWLVDNLDYLSEALGLELEAISSEVAVDSFSADIVAKEAGTGDRVLIENQLESSDHKHLGQVLTYLAGLRAKTIVWIAPAFREAHRSAIRWLNENTVDDFAFFAVRLRVVRIGESPFAPVFEVVEKPNAWDRRLGEQANTAESELSRLRQRFWDRYLEKHPDVFEPTRVSNVWLPMRPDGSIVLSMYVGSKTSGMFLRGPRASDGEALAKFTRAPWRCLRGGFRPLEAKPVRPLLYNQNRHSSARRRALGRSDRLDARATAALRRSVSGNRITETGLRRLFGEHRVRSTSPGRDCR